VNIRLRIYGTPAAQGSKRHVGNGVMVEMGQTRIKPWREAVYSAVLNQYPDLTRMLGPVSVRAVFLFERPLSHYGSRKGVPYLKDTAPTFKSSAPDVDKCLRALLDPLTQVGVWKDDSQVVIAHAVKRYCSEGDRPGAIVNITDSMIATRNEEMHP
jgi:crossover junction endodeoxyribonuclease RusA